MTSADGHHQHPVKIEPAESGDLAALIALLDAADLPVSDLTAALLDHFYVARGSEGRICGVIGLESGTTTGLLRSLAVAEGFQGCGLGRRLTNRIEDHARTLGMTALYLLTMDAERYFATLGYRRVGRASAPAEIAETEQFRTLCPDSAICMTKRL